ncbi:hypothetical protein FE257_006561 [Aspergillus nanangensis]|uniref:OTU domain-containing protein n=1 Tax=Aspergillus nanangensis TaxID=2582783 RepID=A0AAD4GZ74_ASPNN|nr:hypothetical protein FE257_006561 [Aspergillus nanangensis]
MADVQNGGRIVPLVTAPQHYSGSAPSHEPLIRQHPQQMAPVPPRELSQSSSSRNTRSKIVETECLELPCLKKLSLYALPTEGDGNCLYYALSDQLYGDFTHADDIRIRLADHIAANRDYFISFIAAVGGERRAPRRAAASAARYSYCSSSSASASPAPPSIKDKERSFDSKVAESRKRGVWGGAEEIQAFCQSYKRDVNVYTMYGIQNFRDVHAPDEEERELVHIAFHDFHHYSSVRCCEGPHTGLPGIPTFENDLQKEASSTTATVVEMASPWKISAIQEGLGGNYDRDAIIEMLHQCRGNIDSAFENLLADDTNGHLLETATSRAIIKSHLQPSSRSSSPFSTGSKRSADDSDADDVPRPAVRRTRHRERKRRILPDVTVGIAFRDEQDDLVSLRLRVSPDAATAGKELLRQSTPQTESEPVKSKEDTVRLLKKKSTLRRRAASTETPQQTESTDNHKPRRSQRLSRSRNPPQSF